MEIIMCIVHTRNSSYGNVITIFLGFLKSEIGENEVKPYGGGWLERSRSAVDGGIIAVPDTK